MRSVTPKSVMFTAFCPLYVTERPVMIPCSLPKAMKLPVTVSAPKSTSKPTAAIFVVPRFAPYSQYSATPTSVAASAPNMCEIAMRCGIAVIGTCVPIGMPMIVPRISPPAIQS